MDDRTNSTQLEASGEIAIVDERTIRDKIYIIRGVKVMLDFELAEIYGYTTKAFNQQSGTTSLNSMKIFVFSLQETSIRT